ncbi:hypothetical protein DFR70_12070 [Nocardia tenerifensis]|uniref:Uncharacterized protein n=1 Tax=Nocardia tenerifensis TaxID=228006 RepID=A0A318JQE4_9NOCA|nr:hypothetical protein DFR70_12070 [Nocardia tenerifensis]
MTIHLERGDSGRRASAPDSGGSVFQSGGQIKQMPARPKVTPSQPKTSRKHA